MVRRNNHLKIGRYHQHLHELLDMDVSPIAYMMKQFPDELKEIDAVRKIIGRYGITGKAQVRTDSSNGVSVSQIQGHHETTTPVQ